MKHIITPLIFSFAVFVNAAVAQQVRMAPDSMEDVRLSFAPIVSETAPAVVNVFATRTVRQQSRRSPFMNDPFFRRFFGDDAFGMPRERVQNSLGSGVIVGPDGVVVTNNHVIEGGDAFKVVLSDRREFDAELILADDKTDLAVLKIDAGNEALPFLSFADSDTAEVGDVVLAVGNPFGVGQTVTTGIVSALARTQVGVSDYQFFIQTDAAINPGNSGGALVDIDGRLLGVNTAIFSRSGGSNGIGFAIPANMVSRVVSSAVDGGVLARPWLGANTDTVTAALADTFGLDRPIGAVVTEIYKGGPADRAGLKRGDIVLSADGFDIFDSETLRYRLATGETGDEAALTVKRDGKTRNVRLKLSAPPETPKRDLTDLDGRHPLNGAVAGNLSPAFAEEIGRDLLDTGVILTGVQGRSVAARYGFRRGDKILTVNGAEVKTVKQLIRELSRYEAGWSIELERRGRVLSLNTR
ncbi:MAG: Do family serine endopeptidase [Pseudomonadota bacterium]